MKKSVASQGQSASELISKRIAELGDWRGETLGRMRKLIKEADPDVVEEWKWMGTPIWSHDGIICTGESYKNVVKLTFSKGASLKDPARLFNSSLDGNARRAIDIHEGEEVDQSAFKALVRQAVALNSSGRSKPAKRSACRVLRRFRPARTVEGDRLANERLEGGLVTFFSFVDVDRAACVSVETRVEETGRILQLESRGTVRTDRLCGPLTLRLADQPRRAARGSARASRPRAPEANCDPALLEILRGVLWRNRPSGFGKTRTSRSKSGGMSRSTPAHMRRRLSLGY